MSKKKRTKSKAAQATAEARAARAPQGGRDAGGDGHPEIVEFKGGGGMMTSLRGGFQGAVSGASDQVQGKKKGWLNTVLWIAIIAGAAAFVMGGR